MQLLTSLAKTQSLPASEVRILIVSPDPLINFGLRRIFTPHPALQVVGITKSYAATLTAIGRFQPDLVIMDVDTPEVNSQAMLQQIKAQQPRVQVLILTMDEVGDRAIPIFLAGASAYCTKGAHQKNLLLAIACIQDGGVYLDPQIAPRIFGQLKPNAAHPANGPLKPAAKLSERELRVLQLLVQGNSNAEIAASLYLSLSTVKTHIRSIMNKMSVSDRVQIAVTALQSGLI